MRQYMPDPNSTIRADIEADSNVLYDKYDQVPGVTVRIDFENDESGGQMKPAEQRIMMHISSDVDINTTSK